ncbi:hypothetical protein [Celeribacter marinus]|uniref:Uncharacterized protein n=1 Tax=Celeribacter marinus TaxID=1397108 RepID=A0A0P0A532_9RHOB|nr:hypothetical protein [Celeribacter marinus]ALI55668.1 hypothetical protein IMCC12053_1721 [Celeribacter marinus]SFK25672.1 hypothetical protein SAMN05444421_102272 [Celeribacter marinus]
MTQKTKKIEQLKDVAQVTLTLELGRLAQIRAEEVSFQSRLDALKDSAKQRSAQMQSVDDFDSAMRGGADAKWTAWLSDERRRVLRDMATIAERREVQFELTRRAFGKVEALKALAKKSASKP